MIFFGVGSRSLFEYANHINDVTLLPHYRLCVTFKMDASIVCACVFAGLCDALPVVVVLLCLKSAGSAVLRFELTTTNTDTAKLSNASACVFVSHSLILSHSNLTFNLCEEWQ